jgi:hypothetical protein
MLRMCVLTVFTDTGSSAAISCRDRFVGRYRSTFSSPALISFPREGTGRSVPPGTRRSARRGCRLAARQQRTRPAVVAVTVSGGDLILVICGPG